MTKLSTIPFESRRVRLRPPSPPFLDQLYGLAVTAQIPWSWESAAETPQSFGASLSNGVLSQYAIEDRRNDQQVGLVTAYGANLFHSFAYFSLTILPEFRRRVWPLEGSLLFTNYLFTKFNLRNLYAESAESHYEQFNSGAGSMFEVEGVQRGRVVVNSNIEDLYLLAISRERWFDTGVKLLEHALQGPRLPAESGG